jgi:hypothetical protein
MHVIQINTRTTYESTDANPDDSMFFQTLCYSAFARFVEHVARP